MDFTGRTLAYSSNSRRSNTLTDRKPVPTGVVSGPLRARRVCRKLSTVQSGSGVPSDSRAARPPVCSSQSKQRAHHLEDPQGCLCDLRTDAVAPYQSGGYAHYNPGASVSSASRKAVHGSGPVPFTTVRHQKSPNRTSTSHYRQLRPPCPVGLAEEKKGWRAPRRGDHQQRR